MKEAEVAEKFAKQRADAQSDIVGEDVEEELVMPKEARVEELGNLLFRYAGYLHVNRVLIAWFSDGKAYLEAEFFNPPGPLSSVEYKRLWLLQEFHDDFFSKTKHRRYIPRLGAYVLRLNDG